MTKKSPPKTAFYKVSVGSIDPFVVEATSDAEAVSFAAREHINVEPYPVDKLVAYIQAGGVPIKVPPKPKRPYAKKAGGARSVPRETQGLPASPLDRAN